jgi:GNAT superfamily N-acetyltransferase
MEILEARLEHLDGVRRIADAYGNLDDWGRPDYLDLELRERGLWVAVERGDVVGFAGWLRRGWLVHLGDLFVDPKRLGEGIGRRLLEASLPGDGVVTTLASRDERALPLYARFGLRPIAPVLYLEGSFEAEGEVERVPVEDLPAPDRPDQLRLLAETGGHGLVREGAWVAVRPTPGGGAWLGPGESGADDVLAFAGSVERAKVTLPGPHPAVPPLLAAGFRVTDIDFYMASELDAWALDRYFPAADLG